MLIQMTLNKHFCILYFCILYFINLSNYSGLYGNQIFLPYPGIQLASHVTMIMAIGLIQSDYLFTVLGGDL